MQLRTNHRPRPHETPSFLAAWNVQVHCLAALMVRDMMTRYGRANVGFLWIIIEPMLLTAGVMLIWSFIKSSGQHGIGLLTIVMTGYLPLTLWRHMTGAGVHAFRRSIGILYHRHVSMVDTLLARLALEFAGTTAALFTIYGVLAIAGAVEPVRDPVMLLLGWISMAFLSLGVAFSFSVLTEYFEVAERFIAPLQYLILPISGSFYMVEWIPYSAQRYALFVPTVHCYEMFRAGFLGDGTTAHYWIWYPFAWGAVFMFLGAINIEAVRDRLHSS